ncbi:hypothetical protein V2J09_000479 [Rumex salicifolius]
MSPRVVLFFIIMGLVSLVSAAPTHIYTYCPNTTFFPSTNSALRSSLDNLLSDLSAAANKSSTPGFHNSTTVGSPAAAVFYGLYLCRGDDNAATCRECVAAASAELSQNCPLGKQAVTWYDECMIRYSNASFFAQVDTNFGWLMWNTNNITGNVTHFDEVLSAALNHVATKAASGTATLKFGTEEEKFDEFRTLYVLGQCTPDLSASDCYDCLLRSANSVPRGSKQGGRVLYFSCNLRYEIYRFYQQILSPAPTPAPTTTPPPDTTTAPAAGGGKSMFNLNL